MNPLHLFYITNIRIMQDITNGRCGWCGTDELYVKYHDQEWGKLVTDDKTLFEFLVLESAQAGLSWITILRKREGYRKAFYNFDAELVAQMTDEDIERLMQFEGIVKGIYNQLNTRYMKNLFKMYRDWRNRKFVEKIDKLYFHKDKQGNRFMKGTLLVVYDNKTGAYGNVMACLEEDLDKTLSKVSQIRIQLQKEMKHYHDIKSKLTYGS